MICRVCSRRLILSSRYLCAQVAAEAPLQSPPLNRTFSAKVENLVEQISNLSLSETADLNDLLKIKLRIEDLPVVTAAAPLQSPTETETKEEAPQKLTFNVVLKGFEQPSKVKVIKAIRNLIEGMNLIQAKKFVESAPQILKKDIPKAEAEKVKGDLEAQGAQVDLE